MPKNTQHLSKKIARKEKHNSRVSISAMDDDSALFGRAIKALGNCRFRVVVPDARGSLKEEEARIGGKSVIRIEINDIVIVARSGKDLEIMGRMDRKGTARLQKENRIHPALITATEITADMMKKPVAVMEEGFEFDYENALDAIPEADDETDAEKAKHSSTALDDDIDIDDI